MSLFRRIRKQPVEVPIRPESPNHPVVQDMGAYEETIWYADNREYAQALTIYLSSEEWSKFANQEFYQDMIEYLHNEEIEVRKLSNEGRKEMNREELKKIILEQAENRKEDNKLKINQMAEEFVELLREEKMSYRSAKEVLREAQKKLQKLAMERPLN